MKQFGFSLNERLKSRKTISRLFSEGKSLLSYPVKAVFIVSESENQTGVQAAFSVSKKNFKNAVDRNLVKRRMREAFRLNKPDFLANAQNGQYAVMFVYIASEALPSPVVHKALKILMSKLGKAGTDV